MQVKLLFKPEKGKISGFCTKRHFLSKCSTGHAQSFCDHRINQFRLKGRFLTALPKHFRQKSEKFLLKD